MAVARSVWNSLVWLHRWLGIAVGLVMTIWCLSGFVMMYQDYPHVSHDVRARGSAPLSSLVNVDWAALPLSPEDRIVGLTISEVAGSPLLRLRVASEGNRPQTVGIDLRSGHILSDFSESQARQIAEGFADGLGIKGRPISIKPIDVDQWTLQVWRNNQPLYKVDFDDRQRSVLYVSGQSGQVVQYTTQQQRFWNYLGAVPHWIYPTLLRRDPQTWSSVVVGLSTAGVFLTAFGIVLGVKRLRRNRQGQWGSPYRHLWWYHHVIGLTFGVLTLTWVVSGLLSMNPWNLLSSNEAARTRDRLTSPISWKEAQAGLSHIPDLPDGTFEVEWISLKGVSAFVTNPTSGGRQRFNMAGKAEPLTARAITTALGDPLQSFERLTRGDAYYYSHKDPITLPVWRAVLADKQHTRIYIDPGSGQILSIIDRDGRFYRWLEGGLHNLDFPGLRVRPLWDGIVILLLIGVTGVCFTGTWMGVNRLRMLMRRSQPPPAQQQEVESRFEQKRLKRKA